MRLSSWVMLIATVLTAVPAMADNGYPSRTGGNYSGPRWYGYFYNNNFVSANADHTNMTMVAATEKNEDHGTQESNAKADIEAGLKIAQKYGEQAMVDLGAVVFIETSNASPYGWKNTFCYYNNSTAAADFQNLVQTLEADGYLIPNHPELSTVSSFYVADEPDLNCLDDSIGSTFIANSALQNAITAIRQNPDTMNFPLATIVTFDHYLDMPAGMALFDWVGLDDYHHDVTDYLNNFVYFQSILANNADYVGGTPQHLLLVPLVSNLGSSFSPPYTDGASPIYQKFLADNKVIGIMPFKWSPATDTNGMNATSSWAPGYIAIGQSIVAAGSPSPYQIFVAETKAAEVMVIVNSVLL
jgi:hypothetical protein